MCDLVKDIYNKTKCRYIDIPLAVMAVVLAVLMCTVIVCEGAHIRTPLNLIFFPLLSVFANLLIWKMIQLTLVSQGIRIKRKYIIVMSGIFILTAVYYVWAVFTRNHIYYWDQCNYLVKQYTMEETFADNALGGIKHFIRSLSDDYTNFINIFAEFPFCITDKKPEFYVLMQLVNVFAPLTVLFGALIIKIGALLNIKDKDIYFCISMPFIALLPLLHAFALINRPDWYGLIFCMIIVLLTIDERFKEKNITVDILLIITTFLLIITRRWYLYFLVGYCTAYAFVLVYDIISEYRKGSKQLAVRQMKNIAVFGIFAAAIICIICFPIIKHILSFNYAERYASYMKGGFTGECLNQSGYLGGIYIVLIILGAIIPIFGKSKTGTYMLSCFAGIFISVFMFTRVQNMGPHQSLLLVPYYIILIASGCAGIVSVLKNLRAGNIVCAGSGIAIASVICVNYLCLIPENNFVLSNLRNLPESRDNIKEIRSVSKWIDNNCNRGGGVYYAA